MPLGARAIFHLDGMSRPSKPLSQRNQPSQRNSLSTNLNSIRAKNQESLKE